MLNRVAGEGRIVDNLDRVRVLSFDCYGTLIDWESGILSGLEKLATNSSVGLSADQVLEAHAFHESSQQSQTPYLPYSDLLAIVYRRLAEDWDVKVKWRECREYGRSVGNWPAFGDSTVSLRRLQEKYQLVILSNVDNDSFELSRRQLGVEFSAVYTAQDIGSYKPSKRNFHYMLEKLARRGISQNRILHVAESLFHDHVPASQLGLRNCWINRRCGEDGFGAARRPKNMPCVEARFSSLEEFTNSILGE